MEGLILTNAQAFASLQMGRVPSDSRGWSRRHADGGRWCTPLSHGVSGWPCKAGGCCFFFPPPNVSISFSSRAPESSAESHRGASSRILTPYCSPSNIRSPPIASSPSKPSHHITLIYSSLCYSQVARLPTQPSKCLLVLPPLVQWWPLSLSLRCPSATLTTPASVYQSSPKWAKIALLNCWRGGQHVRGGWRIASGRWILNSGAAILRSPFIIVLRGC